VTGKTDKIIDKISKLLAMANDSSSPNEAMIAAKRARALMDKHQIEISDIENAKGSQFLSLNYDLNGSRTPKWMVMMASAAAGLNDCRALRVSATKEANAQFMFQGFKADAIVCKLTFEYFIEACERQLKSSGVKGTSKRNFFRMGFTQRISLRCLEIKEERKKAMVTNTGTALIPLKQAQIAEHFGDYDTFNPGNTRPPSRDEMEAYRAGVTEAENIGLDPQVSGKEAKSETNNLLRNNKETMTPSPSKEQLKALESFKSLHAENWKDELSQCWMKGNYPRMSSDDSAYLQQLRNQFGPKWLAEVN